MYGELFISKVLDTGDVHAFDRFAIRADLLPTEAERRAVEFIKKYAEDNYGEVPSYHTVEAEIESFTYVPEVTDTFKYLADEIKDYAAKKRVNDLWTGDEAAQAFKSMPIEDFLEMMKQRFEDIQASTSKAKSFGFDLKKDIDKYQAEFQRRKDGKSFKIWKSKFDTITNATGGYLSGNTYAWFGRSGRGKSVFVMSEAIESAFQGANVLIWSLEMGWYELASRMLAAISAHEGLLEAMTAGGLIDVGFETKALLMGKMPDEIEGVFIDFMRKLNEILPGNIVIRGVDDPEFTRRDASQLEADIKRTEADIVVVDPIYYMQMEANTSKTSGGDVAKTSMKLRYIAGRHDVVMHVITQAEEIRDDQDENGIRELRAPKRAEVKKASQILEDATNLFGIDTCDGRGVIVIGKGRNGGEDIKADIQYMPEVGIVREIKIDTEAASQFTNVF
jgi:replicative DNA helicase